MARPMIISASYKTDIPAFYGDWFMARLKAGDCRVVNPYGRQVYTVRLDAEAVSGIVFWTKNLGPFLDRLPEIRALGHAFVVHYSINAYPRALETSVSDPDRAVAHMHRLARTFGKRAAVWRYDPVVATSLTPPDWHLENFARLARALAGATDEVVVSFAHIYRKTRRNMEVAARAHGFSWSDPADDEKRHIVAGLAERAAESGMRLTICSQPQYRIAATAPARCIDAERLGDMAGRPIAARMKPHRPECGCFESRDIGDYDSCPHGCVYCYAVHGRARARRRHADHDPKGALLLPPAG